MELVNFSTEDGLRLDGLLVDGRGSSAIVHIHGKCGNFYQNDFIQNMISGYAGAGCSFLAFNHRGHDCVAEGYRDGEVEYIGGSMEIFEECVLDIAAGVRWLRRERGYETIILQGHSNGSEKSLYYAVTSNDPGINGLVLLGLSDSYEMQRRWESEAGTRLGGYAFGPSEDHPEDAIFLSLTAYGIHVGGKHYPIPVTQRSFENLMRGAGTDISRLEAESTLAQSRFDGPILMCYGEDDPYLTVPVADMASLVQRRTGVEPTIEVLERTDHHFKSRQTSLVETVLEWIRGEVCQTS